MIARDPSAASAAAYDLMIIGGGMYGVSIAYEAARRGLRPLLLEKDDFGGATSSNSLRIVHGGLRYLQTFDIGRHVESVRERRWFLRTFPELVRPLPCLMPLYADGGFLKSRTMLRGALLVNDALSMRRNDGVRADRRLAAGEVVDAGETLLRFPLVRRQRLRGAAFWYDAAMLSPQRIVMSLLREACVHGAAALNYVEATSLITARGRVRGVTACDRLTRETLEFHAPVVINAAGPWCAGLASRFDPAATAARCGLFRPSMAYNLLLDRPPLSESALALGSGRPGSRVYFLYSASGGVLAGTEHVPMHALDEHGMPHPKPTPEQVQQTLDELNRAVPGLDLTLQDVRRVYSGLLPAKRSGSAALACRPRVLEHARGGGPRGLYSVSGVKFTTARLVAERVVVKIARQERMFLRHAPHDSSDAARAVCGVDLIDARVALAAPDDALRQAVSRIAAEESVVYVDDLLRRRTSWLDDPGCERAVRSRIGNLMHALQPCASQSAMQRMDDSPAGAMLPARANR